MQCIKFVHLAYSWLVDNAILHTRYCSSSNYYWLMFPEYLIQNVADHMTALLFFRILDLSFNLIKTIQNIDSLTKLKKLFLVQNKISTIEGLQNLSQLEMLELGANKIRVR